MTTSHADQEPAMSRQRDVQEHDRRTASHDPRQRLLAAIPVTERRLRVAGVSTAVLEGGDGPPIVLLHSSGEFAALWMRVIPNLVTTHRVVAPDLPGHGASEVTDGPLDVDHMVRWLDALIERTCQSPPALVGHGLGGAIAAHFAIAHADRLSGLVLVDAFGLDRFEPAPSFGLALHRFMEQPTEHTRDGLFQQCFVDLDGLRQQLGGRWEPLAAYALDRARTPGQQGALGSLMPQLGLPTIPPADLARISVPTTLIWGRQDLQVRLQVAEATSARHGWPLHVIENAGDDPPFEQPEAFLRALHAARLSESRGVRMSTQAYKDAVELAVDRWNAHDERYFEAYTEDASMHGFPANVPPTVEGIRALFGAMWAAFPDIRVEIEHLGVEDDVAALHFRVRGTHAGEFMGAAPTGNRIDVEVMTFLRFGPEGKIVERWNRMDEVGMMTQLGLMPAPA